MIDGDEPRVLVVTGSNRGLGAAIEALALEQGWKVFGCHRTPPVFPPPESVRLTSIRMDMLDTHSIDRGASEILRQTSHIDFLINNSALSNSSPEVSSDVPGESELGLSATGLHNLFQVNSVAPMLLTSRLLTALRRGRRPLILNVSSVRGSLAQMKEKMKFGYGASKCALNHLTRNLAFHLKGDNVRVIAVHPGWMRTALGGPEAPLDPSDAARALLTMYDSLALQQSGSFLDHRGALMDW